MPYLEYNFAADKVPAAVDCILTSTPTPRINILHFLAIAHLADIDHLNTLGWPIFGGTYEMAPFAPLHIELAATIKGDPIQLAMAGLNDDYNWSIEKTEIVLDDKWRNISEYRQFLAEPEQQALIAATRLFCYKTPPNDRPGLFCRRAQQIGHRGQIGYDKFQERYPDPVDEKYRLSRQTPQARNRTSLLA